MLRAQRLRRPNPRGNGEVVHDALGEVLLALRSGGVPALVPMRERILAYRDAMALIDPDHLDRPEALAYWLNLYNAGALDLAATTYARSEASVLRVPGAFAHPWVTVAGEPLSLDGIEHGKIRHFGDPRIHGALVCGSASCPTLRYEPYDGSTLDTQLDDQLTAFLAGGGAVADEHAATLRLSRVFLWYGADFVRPHAMPAWLPASRRAVATAIEPWLPTDVADWVRERRPSVAFQPYDWSLACAVAPASGSPAQSDDH